MRSTGEILGVDGAYRALENYGRKYGKLSLRLLLHVAVPQRFRADFVNLVKLNFLPAEAQGDLSLDAEVLFAPVVEHLGAGYFRMDGEVRRQSLMLLDAAYRDLGELRSVRVADLLLSHLADLEHRAAVGLDPQLEDYVTTERWVAYAFLNPADAATRFAWALKHATDAEAGDTAKLKVRFGSIAAAITIPLSGDQDLLEYARGYDALVSGRTDESAEIFRRLGDGEIRVGEVELRPETLTQFTRHVGVTPIGYEAGATKGIAQEWLRYAPKPRQLSANEKWNVFLSYRSVNRAWVLNLYDLLQELGHAVFLHQVALKAGEPLIDALQKALQASQAGVLIWSSASDSEWVSREYQTLEKSAAVNKGFQFVPLRLDRSPLPLFAENRIYLDFADYPDGPNGGELLRLLHAIAGKPLSTEAAHFAAAWDEAAKQAADAINAAIANGNAERLKELFEQSGLPWRISAILGCKAAEGLTKLGRNDEAIAMLSQLEAQFPKAIRPRQLHALALARRAARAGSQQDLDNAQEILAELYAGGERDPETLGIYARTWMDRHERDASELALRRSRDLYAEAFEGARDDYYTGINAAAKSVFLGTPEDLERAGAYATRVLDIVGTKVFPGDYWKTATVAEALLMQKSYGRAGEVYRDAVAMAPEEIGSHMKTWLQARRLMNKLGATDAERALVQEAFTHLGDATSAGT
jgi:hypothetical protein